MRKSVREKQNSSLLFARNQLHLIEKIEAVIQARFSGKNMAGKGRSKMLRVHRICGRKSQAIARLPV